jgi:hypothetical protein
MLPLTCPQASLDLVHRHPMARRWAISELGGGCQFRWLQQIGLS